jgi:hypothetical protein
MAKNLQVAEFYENAGFILEYEDEKESEYYKIDLSKTAITLSSNYKFV